MNVAEKYEEVVRRVNDAARRASRPSDVRIVAVTKTFPAQAVVEALRAGITDIGENRAQELRDKFAAIGDRARWHFIGPLQTNKVRLVVGVAALVHSVDRLQLAQAIARRARSIATTQDVLIEVNLSGEDAKHGVEPGRALSLAAEVASLEGISVRGLMTMPPFPRDPQDSRPFYRRLARLSQELRGDMPDAHELSMGMTRDFEVAVEEGATIVRIGEAIFGPRPSTA